MTDDITEFHRRAASVALVKMFHGSRHFSVCDLDAVADTLDRKAYLAGRDYAALRALHCVDWATMGPDLRRMVHEKCFELLGLPPQTIDLAEEVNPTASAAPKPKLAFWRRT